MANVLAAVDAVVAWAAGDPACAPGCGPASAVGHQKTSRSCCVLEPPCARQEATKDRPCASRIPAGGDDDAGAGRASGEILPLGLYPGFGGYQVCGPVQERLAAKAPGDVAGLANGLFSGFGIS